MTEILKMKLKNRKIFTTVLVIPQKNTCTSSREVIETEDQWSEDEAEIPAGVTDTMLTSTDFVEDNGSQCILSVAPGEGKKPGSIFQDQYS